METVEVEIAGVVVGTVSLVLILALASGFLRGFLDTRLFEGGFCFTPDDEGPAFRERFDAGARV